MSCWYIRIHNKQGLVRSIPLSKDYESKAAARKEAEEIADEDFDHNDDKWELCRELEPRPI